MTKARDLANSAAAFAAVSATELGYVDGVTSAIQTQIDAKAPSSTAATLTGTQTLTNKTIDTASNTITGAVTLTGTQTLTNKTLTSPVIASVINNTLTSTTGDIIYASAANTPARLGIGTTGQVLNVSGGIPAWATPSAAGFSGAQARNTTSQSIPNSTETAVIFDSEIFDSGSYWDTGNNTRFTVPSTGKYSISVAVLFHFSPPCNITLKIYKNGSFVYQIDRWSFTASCNGAMIGKTSLINLTAADYVEIFVNQNSGGAQSIQGNNSEVGCMQWSITYLGA